MTHEVDVLQEIRAAKRVVILAGAGMSADLGVPVYWEGNNSKYGSQETSYGYTALQHANASLYRIDPLAQYRYHKAQAEWFSSIDVVDSHYGRLREFLGDKPAFVATTNVDSAFKRAGFEASKVWEVHGSYEFSQCSRGDQIAWKRERYASCPQCSGVSRPNILFFEDRFYTPTTENFQCQFEYIDWVDDVFKKETVVLEIGVGTTVPRLVSESLNLLYRGFKVFRINPESSDQDDGYSGVLHMNAADFVDALSSDS
jgi:NAD-dependent SIR2 family protein deacetylase